MAELMIIDAFMMSDEIDLLHLRLGQLNSVVDKFVFIETDRTFQGQAKPLYYKENAERFTQWKDKIIYATPHIPHDGAWACERHHRDALGDLVKAQGFLGTDTLSYSDMDEIPNPDILKIYCPDWGLCNLRQYTFYYNFNHLMNYGGRSWSRARIGPVQALYDFGTDEFRGGKRDMDPNFPSLENGGWHCSYFGSSLNRVRGKVNAFSHDDMAPIINNESDRQLASDISNGVDLFHRDGVGNAQHWDINDSRLPSYFLENQERFKMFTNKHFVEVHKELLA
jgi:beta-1,4-mannosyl-glycoprotein beta-1,4-N-acetylglucosaminyltransferase